MHGIHAGVSLSSEVSGEDYGDLIGRMHGMRFSFLGEGASGAGSSEMAATTSGKATHAGKRAWRHVCRAPACAWSLHPKHATLLHPVQCTTPLLPQLSDGGDTCAFF